MKKLLLLSLLGILMSFRMPSITGTWIPLHEDRITINEELTFSDDTLFWSTGSPKKISAVRYKVNNNNIDLMYKKVTLSLPIRMQDRNLVIGNIKYITKLCRERK